MSQPTDRRSSRSARRPSRRKFFAQSATGAASLGAVAFGMPKLLRAKDLNGKLNIAIIGCGGRGGANLQGVASENIVALCDVNENGINQWKEKYPHARRLADFRKLYDHASEFDAVVVSTPEHTHAFATLPALRLGKHVYCEKPLSHSVYEARVVRETAAKANVATQMGTQIHAGGNYRRVVELIRAGAIGPVREAHVWVGRTWGRMETEEEAKKHGDIVFVKERPQGSSPVPPGVDWDLWVGPAPARPFHEVYLPGPKWYRWWDFGNGTMSDLGSHWNDLPFWALDLKAPTSIEASGPAPHPEIAPATMSAKYEFPSRGTMPAVTMTWYQGQMKPPQWTEKKIPQWDSGVLFVGDKGMLLSDYGRHLLLPEESFKDFVRPEPTIPASIGHYAEWIHAAKTGAPTTCNFEYAGSLTESNHLGNVAFRVGKKIEWNAEKMEATNCPEAAPLIRREYRAGWTL
jgi:predicted dehydrogenase